jgi:histidine triad (HIT) family protein
MENIENCVFCKIVAGQIPSHKIYEDENFMAFLDIHPQAPGHSQIVTKKHYRWVWDVPNVKGFFEVARKIAKAEQKAFNTEWILSKIVGDEVGHAHIWIYPNTSVQGDKMDFDGNAKKLVEALESQKGENQ